MNSDKLKSNYLKILIHLVNQLEKKIYLFRISFYGDTEKYFSDGILLSKRKLEMESNEFEMTFNLSMENYRHIVDSCEIEQYIRLILHEMTNMKTYKSLKEIIIQLENERTAFKKHKKLIEAKGRQIDELKEVLPLLQEQARVTVQRLKTRKLDAIETAEKLETLNETDFLKRLMDYKFESRKNYYEHKLGELKTGIEWFERETGTQDHADVQTVSFWLLKYDDYSEKLDMQLKQMFDNWAAKRRELEILRKYRKLNVERIQKLNKFISEREDYIENYRKMKELEQKKREEELKRQAAATIIQSYWRGTMVRKHLGPYKVKKSKKGKGKKGKGKKKKK